MKHSTLLLIVVGLLASLIWSNCGKKPEATTENPDPQVSEPDIEKVVGPASTGVPVPVPPETPESAEPPPPAPTLPTVGELMASELEKLCQNPSEIQARYPGIREELLSPLLELYQARGFEPWWFPGGNLNESAAELVEALELATAHGLDPDDYLRKALRTCLRQLEEVDKDELPRLAAWTDVSLALSALSLAHDLQRGAIPHQQVIDTWEVSDKSFNLESLLTRILEGEGARKILEAYSPQHQGYQHLRQALDTYRTIAAGGGWQPIDPSLLNGIKDGELEKGHHELVPLLRKRLAAEGYDLNTPDDPEKLNHYDDALKSAVKKFQALRGLDQDGIIGPMTLQALNVPVENLIEKIVLSLDRWRWLPEELGDRYILVNVPEFTLRAYSGGENMLQMGVIVGDSSQGTWTPIFADQMEYVIFRPYWNVPPSIIKGELLPEIKKDRGYIRDFNYELVDRFSEDAEVFKPSRRNVERLEKGELKIRQTSGPYNALGLVKFIFPNRHSVYLHDTNQRSLFVHSKRDFSHGCIRVQNPEGLARYALPESVWSLEKIRDAMNDKKRQMVSVGSPIPVYIFYLTAFADNDGPAGFFEDLYHYDRKMAQLKSVSPAFSDAAPQTATHP